VRTNTDIGVAVEPLPFGAVAPGERTGKDIARSPMRIAMTRFRHDKVAMASLAFIVLLVCFAVAAPLVAKIAGHSATFQGTNTGVGMDANGVPVGIGVNGYILGAADTNGHDMLVWLAYGARTSLFIGVVSTFLTMVIALLAGIVAGFFGGIVDTSISRLIDLFTAFPFLLFGIAATLVFGQGRVSIIIAIIVVFSWYYPARIFRADILALREREFVEAARMVGASNWRIMRTHLLPHLVPPLVVLSTVSVASAILFEAAISFLGFGLSANQPSWGYMINEADTSSLYNLAPNLLIIPGMALFLTVLAFNLLGDGLRDALDPRGGLGA
jgi:peptide/nickel transport system permease protein